MPKNEKPRSIDQKRASSRGYTFVSGNGGGGGVTDHGWLTGLLDDDHPQYLDTTRGDLRYVPTTRQVTGVNGLTGGGALSGDLALSVATGLAGNGLDWQATGVLKVGAGDGIAVGGDTVGLATSVAGNGLDWQTSGVLKVGAGDGITVNANDVALTTPGTLSISSSNVASGNHTHGVTSSANPGAAASLLASDGGGKLRLKDFEVGSQGATTPAIAFSGADNVAAGPDIAFSGNGLIAAPTSLYLAIDSDNSGTDAAFIVGNNAAHSGFAELMRLTEAGRLGIGTDAPAYNLHVVGTGYLSTSLTTPLIDTASGALTLSPATDVLLSPSSNLVKLQSGVNLQSHNYASQTTGVRVTNSGQGDFRYIFTDELHAKSFIADLEQALAGGQIIAKSVTKLSANWNVTNRGAASTITVDDLPGAAGMAVFQSGDVVGVRNFSRSGGSLTIGDAFGVVTGYTDNGNGTQSWTFTRAATTGLGSGSLAGGTTIQKAALVIDYGVSGNGYHEINAIDGAYAVNSPYSQVVTWSGGSPTATNAKTVRTRLGQLVGLGFDAGSEFGLYAGDGTANSNQYLRISSKGVRLNNIPLQLWASGTQRVNIDATGTEVWFKDSSGNTKLSWNGSTLAIDGDITANNGYIGGPSGWAITSSGTPTISSSNVKIYAGSTTVARIELGSGSGATTAGIRGGDGSTGSGVAFWAGATHANRTSAPFNVRFDGSAYITAGGAGAKDSTLNGWCIDPTEIVGQAAGVDQVVFNTAGNIYAGGGGVGLTRQGVVLKTGDNSPSYTWPFNYGGVHVVDTLPTTGWRTSLMFSEPALAITGARPRAWVFRYNCDLTQSNPGSGWWSYADRALVIEDSAAHVWSVYHEGNFTPSNYALLNSSPAFTGTPTAGGNTMWHAGNDGSGSGLDADYLDGHDTSYFSASTHNHTGTYAPLTGNVTFGGDINTSTAVGGAWQTLDTAFFAKKFGDLIIMRGSVTPGTGTGAFTAGTLPAGYRPAGNVYVEAREASGTERTVIVASDGTVRPQSHSSGVAIYFDGIVFSLG